MREQLQKLNSEIDELAGKAEAAWNAYMDATNPQQKAELKERLEKLEKKEELLNIMRRDLQNKLPSSGEHIVQTASAKAALAGCRKQVLKRSWESWLKDHRLCCYPESAVSAKHFLQHSVAYTGFP